MCGIFGFVSQRPDILGHSARDRLVKLLFTHSETRGKESSGIAVGTESEFGVLKRNIRGKKFGQLPELQTLLNSLHDKPGTLMGHTRMVTNGDAADVNNNQPVVRDQLACIHNGIIVNDAKIWADNADLQRHYQVDTEIFLALVEKELRTERSLAKAIQRAMTALQGANSMALMHADWNAIVLATTNGSLHYLADPNAGIVVFASERFVIEASLKSRMLPVHDGLEIRQLAPGHGAVVQAEGELIREFDLSGNAPVETATTIKRDLIDHGSHSLGAAQGHKFNAEKLTAIEKATHAVDYDAIKRLKRCAHCLLPETFPFIQFDHAGVCSVCRGRQHAPKPGREALMKKLNESGAEARPCLAPVSGGRDSCYGLHYMVHELGIKPVAYTYDWGMVTDLARRNISRMCGALGIEHILVSADIAKKRDFIHKNVGAWLKQPHLGTIPLFMAGDKQFFYYAEKLRQQMRLGAILFSTNPLERTDFKVGFCGIDEGYEKVIYHDPSWLNKLRLAAFFGWQYAKNPAYLNASLLDTAGAYLSYYALPKRYEQLFDFIPWIESEIEDTLINEYDWELAEDTQSTWRIGDGTAAFYNYIYLKVAGFTENDTFRSNQIREGLMDRDTALAKIEEENRPRIASIAWYFDAIGLDAVDAIKRVNSIPVLY